MGFFSLESRAAGRAGLHWQAGFVEPPFCVIQSIFDSIRTGAQRAVDYPKAIRSKVPSEIGPDVVYYRITVQGLNNYSSSISVICSSFILFAGHG